MLETGLQHIVIVENMELTEMTISTIELNSKRSSALHYIVASILLVGFFLPCYSLDKAQVLSALSKAHKQPSCAYDAVVEMKVSIQNRIVSDSGILHFSPPNRQMLQFKGARTKVATIGDTSWTQAPDGSITRRIGSQFAAGTLNSHGTPPEMAAVLKSVDFSIISETPGKDITIEYFTTAMNIKQKVHVIFDTKNWLVRNVTVTGMPNGQIETGFSYLKFKGNLVISEIRAVMGSTGFMVMTFKEYKETKAKAAKEFHLM